VSINLTTGHAAGPEVPPYRPSAAGRRFVISNRKRPVVVALPVEDFEALMI
jgi:hypothetical protein